MISIPSLNDIYLSVKSNIEVKMGTTIGTRQKAFINAMALVEAAKLKLIYLAIGLLQQNIFADTAQSEAHGGTLERFGRVKLGRNPFPATAGVYTLTVTGTVGATIPATTIFKADDDSAAPGKLFVLDTTKTLTATSDTISVRAMEPGTDSQVGIGDTMTATTPIASVNRTATVAAETTAPLAAETIEDYRTKILDAYKLEPQGGSASDYRIWAADAQGVQRVYPYAKTAAAGEINLYVEATADDSSDGKGTPTQAILDDVETVVEFDPDTTRPINERGRRPLGVLQVHYLPVTVRDIDITIPDYVDLDAETQATIEAAIGETVDAIRPFVSACDVIADRNDTLSANNIIASILNAVPGATFGSITMTIDGTPFTSHQFTNGDIPSIGTITFS